MNYMQAWREGHKEGMDLALKLINEFTGQDFKTSSEVVLYIKELECEREANFYKDKTAQITPREEMLMDAMAQKMAMTNWAWSD